MDKYLSNMFITTKKEKNKSTTPKNENNNIHNNLYDIISYIVKNKLIYVLEDENIKNKIRLLVKPFIHELLSDIYPYIYISVVLVVISFLLILSIFIMLVRIHNNK